MYTNHTHKLTDDVDSGDSEEICVMLHSQGFVILDMALLRYVASKSIDSVSITGLHMEKVTLVYHNDIIISWSKQ